MWQIGIEIFGLNEVSIGCKSQKVNETLNFKLQVEIDDKARCIERCLSSTELTQDLYSENVKMSI